jgi:hypothetical protein
MSPDAFRRLTLLAYGCAIAGGIAATAVFVSWVVALGAAAGGALLAVVATVESSGEAE